MVMLIAHALADDRPVIAKQRRSLRSASLQITVIFQPRPSRNSGFSVERHATPVPNLSAVLKGGFPWNRHYPTYLHMRGVIRHLLGMCAPRGAACWSSLCYVQDGLLAARCC
ncbi:hypothetical protein VTK26DRAFT_4637 [Humicola hyalothermophila]